MSLASTITVASPKPEVSEFQLRRRRAAKLTHFFGVDYRELIEDVLVSIEKGVDDERRRGGLDPAEADVCFSVLDADNVPSTIILPSGPTPKT